MDRADTYINYNIDLEETGKNIRTFLKIAGYSARDMEQYLGCTQMTFFNWQEGKNLPGFDNLLRLAGILKVPMEKIVVFKKRDDGIPLKSSNSGFIRNNVFFTYNNATQIVVRDCISFNKKFSTFPDKIIINPLTFDRWIKNQNNSDEKDDSDGVFESISVPENFYAELLKTDGVQYLKTSSFTVEFIWDEEIPEKYYRLIDSKNCSL